MNLSWLAQTIFLPMVLMMFTIQEQGFHIWQNDINQNRPVMHLDERLVNAANYKAKLIAETGIIAHCVNGYCSNQLVHDFGCKTEYAGNSNQVESISVGVSTMAEAYESLRRSPSHQPHILGLDMFSAQDEIGVGYYEFQNNYYYVFLSANCL